MNAVLNLIPYVLFYATIIGAVTAFTITTLIDGGWMGKVIFFVTVNGLWLFWVSL